MYSQSYANRAYGYYKHVIILNPISIYTWVWSHVQSVFPHSYTRIYGPRKNDDKSWTQSLCSTLLPSIFLMYKREAWPCPSSPF